jgi:hypothetical protein
MKKLLFILNPCAGTRKANKVLPEILSVFNRAGFHVQVYITGCQGDATRAVQELASGMDLVVCCGGDGTFNETVTGLLQAGLELPIGYIPAGSTNDFASSLHLPSDPVAAAQAIVSGKPEPYDVGQFGTRYFSYVASFGAFTKASYSTPQNVKNALGHTAYLLEGIYELSQIRKEHVRMELDGEVLEDNQVRFLDEVWDIPERVAERFEVGEEVEVEVDFNRINLQDDEEDGTLCGEVYFILYKGDHYHLTIRTDDGDDLYVDTNDVWDDGDRVGIRIAPSYIRLYKRSQSEAL